MKGLVILILFAGLLSGLKSEDVTFTPEEERKAKLFADPAFCKQAVDSPARFQAQLRGGWEALAERLKNPRHPRYAPTVRLFARIYDEVRMGQDWKVPVEQVVIPRLAAPPEIDGAIRPEEWRNALVFRGEYPLNSSERSEEHSQTAWRIGWHGSCLYAAAEFRDRDIVSYHGRFDTPDIPPLYLGDAFELFLRPLESKPLYYEYLVNPQGDLWALVHVNDPCGSWIRINDDFATAAKTAVRRTADGYTVELAVPLREQYGPWNRRAPRIGDRFSFMMVRTNRDNGNYCRGTPVPLLYEGHNIFGYIRAELGGENDSGCAFLPPRPIPVHDLMSYSRADSYFFFFLNSPSMPVRWRTIAPFIM